MLLNQIRFSDVDSNQALIAVRVTLQYNFAIYPMLAEKKYLKKTQIWHGSEVANMACFSCYRIYLKLWEHRTFSFFLPGKHILLLFVSPKVGQMENISPGQIIDEPIRPVNIPRKEKDFQGMLEYKKEDEQKLVKNLILGKCFPHGVKGLSGTCVSGRKD